MALDLDSGEALDLQLCKKRGEIELQQKSHFRWLEGSEAGIASMLQGGPSNRGTLMLVDFTTKSSATAYTSYIKVQL